MSSLGNAGGKMFLRNIKPEVIPDWYHTSIEVKTHEQMSEIVEWIESNIPRQQENVVWKLLPDLNYANLMLHVRFRNERDYSWFMLKW